MTIRRHLVLVTADAYGDAEVFSPYMSGDLVSIHYVKPAENGFSEYTDVTITSEETGETLWSEEDVADSVARHPRAPTHTAAGAAATYDNTRGVLDKIALGHDRAKIVIAGAGDETSGTLLFIVDDRN